MASPFTLLDFHGDLQLLRWGSSESLHLWKERDREREYGRTEIKGRDQGKGCAMEQSRSWWHLKRNVTARETISK